MFSLVLLRRLQAAILVALAIVALAQPPASVEQRIDRIQNGLLREWSSRARLHRRVGWRMKWRPGMSRASASP